MGQTVECSYRGSKQTAVLILGMHRSGTSLLSSLVQALGITVGENLLPSDIHNPAGYFEDRECVEIQDRLLEALSQPWNGEKGMLPFPSQWWRTPVMQPLVKELAGWIDRRIACGLHIWAVKDPRTTRFLPLWQELLQERGITVRYVLAVRDPAAMVASAVARDNVPARRMYLTWLRYNMEALLYAGANLAGVFIYSQWFNDGKAQIHRLATALDVPIDGVKFDNMLGRLLRSDLQRQDGSGHEAPSWASHVYSRLQELAGQINPREVGQVGTETEYYDAMLRQGETPDTTGALELVLSSKEAIPEALSLASNIRKQGRRVVVGTTEPVSTTSASEIPTVVIEYNGPPLIGPYGQHVRAAYSLWCGLQQRTYSALHIEGGNGLAAHCLAARHQGLPDWNGAIHVHYFQCPSWLRGDGSLHLKGIPDVEALYLERRILSDPDCRVHASPHLCEMLHQLVPESWNNPRNLASEKSSEPLVSICITHYNRPEFLSDCLDSVRVQTYGGTLEVVLVDDGSTRPDVQAFLDSLHDEFRTKNWQLIQRENGYLGAARNTAALAARGEYLFFLDDDNLLMPDGVQHAVRVAQNTGADIVTAVMAIFSGPAGYQPTRPEQLGVHAGNAPLLGVFENNLGDANALIRRSCWIELSGFTEDRDRGAEDWELFAKAILQGRCLEHSLKPLSWYRVAANSMSRTGDWWSDYRRALRSYEAALPAALRELPALAGILMRRMYDLEPFESETIYLRQTLRKFQASLAHAEGLLAHTQEQLAQTQDQLAQTQEHLVGTQGHLHYTQEQLIQSRDQLNQTQEHLAGTQGHLHYTQEQLIQSRDQLNQTQGLLAQAQQKIELLIQEQVILYASTSWKITLPLRMVKRQSMRLIHKVAAVRRLRGVIAENGGGTGVRPRKAK
jgi:hypothetical protein